MDRVQLIEDIMVLIKVRQIRIKYLRVSIGKILSTRYQQFYLISLELYSVLCTVQTVHSTGNILVSKEIYNVNKPTPCSAT